MPYTLGNLPPQVENKPLDQKEAFVKAFNTALDKGRTEEESWVAALGAMRLVAAKNKTVNKQNYSAKPERKLPSHVPSLEMFKALKEEQKEEIVSKALVLPAFLSKHSLPEGVTRNVVAMNFDTKGKLVVAFDTGEKITTDAIAIQEIIEQHVSISAKKQDIVPGNYVTYTKALSGFSVSVTQAEHGVAVVNPVTVRNASGKEVEVSVEVDTAQTVIITSNISLDGHIAVIS